MRIDRFINNKTRLGQKTIRHLLAGGAVKANGIVVTKGTIAIDKFTKIELNNTVLQAYKAHYIMLNKPSGYLSATVDPTHRTILDLIHEPYKDLLHIGGRLDFNTTGLMLLTNDGQWSRKITEPKEKKPKVYLVGTENEITEQTKTTFAQGVYFAREKIWTQQAQLELIGDRRARLTIYEGRYHQVKRMFAQVDNKVTSLHRESMGDIILDTQLQPGEYRELSRDEVFSVEH